MANNDATVIVGKLSDKELQDSINKLVAHVETASKKMADSFDAQIQRMKQSLNGLGNVNINFGGSKSAGEDVVTTKLKKVDQQAKETTVTFDQLAEATKKATNPARDSFYAMFQGFREQEQHIKQLISSWESLALARRIGDFNAVGNDIDNAKQKIRELKEEITQLRRDQPEGYRGLIILKEVDIARLKDRIAELRVEQQKIADAPIQDTPYLTALRAKLTNIQQILNEQFDTQSKITKEQMGRVSVEDKIADSIKAQAKLIRESKDWKEKGWAVFDDRVYYDPERSTASRKEAQMRGTLEEQIARTIEERALAEQRENAEKERSKNLSQAQIDYENRLNEVERERLGIEERITAEGQKRTQPKTFASYDTLREAMAHVLGMQQQQIRLADTETASYSQLNTTLKQLKQTYDRLSNSDRNSEQGKVLVASMHEVEDALRKIRQQAARPVNLAAVMGLSDKNLDDMAYKMQRLASYRGGLNVETQKEEISKVNTEYDRLKKKMDEVMQKNQQMIGSNNALGRSWNYMKNRLAFYFTVGASTQFIKNLIEVRSQYEMNERALGILINSAERGTQIFNELSQMALVSPYTLIELSNAAKQLTAYDIAAKDVVETTRRLADMASAVGVPMERLTYALGQIKAYGYLNSRDARMFANAGIPLVRELSKYYTELEGKMVSVGDVYDRMKKKAIDFNDVMSVVTKMTDEGGKFFDFQAKMADTLKVRLANLTLAWNNMLNDIGKSEQGVLTTGIGLLKDFFLQWKSLSRAVENLAIGFGIVKTAQLLYYGVVMGTNKAIALEAVLGDKLSQKLRGLTSSMNAAKMASATLWVGLATMVASAVVEIVRGNEAMKEFNKTLRENAKNTYADLEKFKEQYSELRDSLYKTTTDSKGASITTPQDINIDEAKKAWEAVREQIELSSHASNEYIGRLLQINNVSERLRQSFNLLDDIQSVSAAIKELSDNAIKLERDWAGWWNLWLLPDGTIGNLKDAHMWLGKIEEKYESIEKARDVAKGKYEAPFGIDKRFQKDAEEWLANYEEELGKFRKDIQSTKESVLGLIDTQGWTGNINKINEAFKQITDNLIQQNQLDPQKAFTLQLEMEEARTKAAMQAYSIRIKDEQNALKAARDENEKDEIQSRINTLNEEYDFFLSTTDRQRVYWKDFTKYLKEQHLSETTAMFRGMDAEQIKSLNFQEGKYADWVKRMVTSYAKSHKLSYDEAFNYLKNWVASANQWSIFIPLTISTEDQKTVIKSLEEADATADKAWKDMQRLDKEISRLRKKGAKEATGDGTTGVIDLNTLTEDDKRLTQAIKERAAAQKDYDKAIAEGGHSKKEDAAATKAQKAAESELQKALKDELQLIDKVRSQYKKLTDAGATDGEALAMVTNQFANSLAHVNKVLGKNGIPLFDISKFAGTDNPRALLDMLKLQLDSAKIAKNIKPEEIKELEVKYSEIVVDAKSYDLTKVTKGLNNELDKLKDEYELAVELDANPELGDMFADMFGINTSTLPQTFGEALDRAQIIINRKLAELNVSSPFDLMQTDINKFTNSAGLEKESEAIKELAKWQNTFRDMFKKNLLDSEKMLDDYVKKYGDYSDKVAEIEADRLEKIKKLNDAYYTEEMRQRPEYIAKMNAINQGASREKSNVEFDAFKNSRYYTMMFENLDYISTKTIRDMRDRLRELMDSMNDLTPEQLKQVITQYEKLEQKLVKRSPFKTLTKDLKNYLKTSSDRKAANEAFRNAQKEYDAQEKNVAALKEKYEQAKANNNTSQSYLDFLKIEIDGENEILRILKEQLDAAQKKADKYNLIKKLALEELSQTATMVAANLKGLAELRDQMNELFGVDASKGETLLGHQIDALIDGLSKASDGISKVTSSAQSGNVFGVVSGVVDVFTGIGDGIASLFGDGSARTKRLNREINESRETVRQLSMAYDDLERAINKSLGTGETEARRLAIANKEAQLAELERQKELEQSKRSKDRDDDAIKQYEESIHSLRNEISDLKEDVVNNLWGEDVKSAAEAFIDAWVQAWRAGETTLDAIQEKMDEMIYNLIKKAMTSKIVETLLNPIYKELDRMTKEGSEGGVALTTNELRQLAQQAGITAGEINTALGEFYGNLEQLGIVSKTEGESNELSALQQGIQGITENTAGALEAYMNGVSQQVYLQSEYLRQICEVMTVDEDPMDDVKVASLSQILLQLRSSYEVQNAIHSLLNGWSSDNMRSIRVEMV